MSDSASWWLQLVGVVAFAVFLGASFLAWRRRDTAQANRSTAALLIAGVALLAVGALAVYATA